MSSRSRQRRQKPGRDYPAPWERDDDLAALRAGIATAAQIEELRTRLHRALEIEHVATPRLGIDGHLRQGLDALATYRRRCISSGTWCSCQLDFAELDALAVSIELSSFQASTLPQHAGRDYPATWERSGKR